MASHATRTRRIETRTAPPLDVPFSFKARSDTSRETVLSADFWDRARKVFEQPTSDAFQSLLRGGVIGDIQFVYCEFLDHPDDFDAVRSSNLAFMLVIGYVNEMTCSSLSPAQIVDLGRSLGHPASDMRRASQRQ